MPRSTGHTPYFVHRSVAVVSQSFLSVSLELQQLQLHSADHSPSREASSYNHVAAVLSAQLLAEYTLALRRAITNSYNPDTRK